ncbi:SCAR/WAVE family [Macleaya cordata]|uniref:Protein SCAR n=1 Tax=Macleaya cordata TaxID=56857 RepID=A0A200Q6W9_MACCD|nr:SCAR/WAVE family [Macleaya cordata]
MPLVRFQVRNEYSLGAQELYRGVSDEDPKGVLEGVTVSGLVGILRQLGDLAEFAAEVFHDLQEQVMTTAARSHKMIARVHHIEASIPAIEKAVLAQKSHIHFAYTNGTEWHPKIQTHRNHLTYSYLPRFIMDTYEECRDPPCFHLLDKFDKGGPGSCLRRYSDPSFFKRAVANSEMLSGDKVQKEKKARKSRKKGLRQRNAEVSHGVSISGRIHFASPTSNGQSSAAETISTFNMRSKSELGDRSTSFDPRTLEVRSTSLDSRTKLGYHEYVFDVRSPIQHEDQEHSELFASRSKLQTNGTGSFLVDEREKGEYDDLSDWSSLESSIPKSSPVTWDEKIEIVKPMHQQLKRILENQGKASELLPSSSDISKLEIGSPTLRNIDPVGILSDSGDISGSVLNGNQSDGVESEADSYRDALNTMESEVETDVECQTKREVELSSAKLKNRGMECETGPMHKISAQTSESSDVETHTASYSSSNNEMLQNFSNSISSEDLIHAQPPQVNGSSSDPYVSLDTGSCGSTDPLDVSRERDSESAINDPSSSGSNNTNSQGPLVDKIVNQLGESEESPATISDAPSVKFWTNGGLLGLQPSKPPDLTASNVESQNSTAGTKNDDACLLSSETTPEHKKKNANSGGGNDGSLDNLNLNDLSHVRRTGNIAQNIDDSTNSKPCHNMQDDVVSKKNAGEIVSPVSEAKIEKSGDSHRSNSINNAQGCGLTETIIMKTGLLKLQDHHIKQEARNRVVCQTTPEKNPKKQIDQGSPVNSVSSSPPLEHMKISVHPINVSETSILKLKFPDGHRFHGSNKDFMFPSFQLLPELSTSLQGIGYESDDDTFYRSSPDMSEELMSQCSDSNSEQWESEETPRSSKGPEIYDAFRRVSTDESISIPFEHEGKIANDGVYCDSDRSPNTWNGIRPLQDGPLLEFPSFDDVNQLASKQEGKMDSNPKDHLDLMLQYPNMPTRLPPPNEPTPPPPPLPPLEWIVMKPNFASEENEQASVSKVVSHLNNLQLPGFIPVEQLKPAQAEQPHIEEAITSPSNSKDQQKSSRSIETIQASNGKDLDEREDLLHQIRSKSFNLRRTTPARPTPVTGPTTNTRVAEILQKANAIRQAFVDSDEGEDDENWSEG